MAQVSMCYPHLAEEFFGPDAFTSDRKVMKEPVRRFIDALMTANWARLRKSIQSERGRLPTLKEKVASSWGGDAFSISCFGIELRVSLFGRVIDVG